MLKPSLLLLLYFAAVSASVARGAAIYLPADPAPAEESAAEGLQHFWERMTGGKVAILSEDQAERPAAPRLRHPRFGGWRAAPQSAAAKELAFFLGETDASRRTGLVPANLDLDGFVLHGGRNRFLIRGGSPEGTRFGVYRFLHEQGVRWFLPNELGQRVPEGGPPQISRQGRVEEPDFLSRGWSGATSFTGSEWEDRNLARRRFRGNEHAVHRIFTEAIYDLRPDFFIMLNGRRIRPMDAKGGHNYQICFGNPDTAKFAARKAAEFFDAHPEAIDFPLGMNDTNPVCQCGWCRPILAEAGEFRDRPDYSDWIFTFMNRVATELERTHPDKFVSGLAYHWAENVPSFPVHPKVIPYLTADRSMWFDEAYRAEDKNLMRRWAAAGPEIIGIYDYYYGSSFVIPRLFTAITGESLRYARELGIRGFYAEIYSNWSLDGPKAWLTSQLLWDVSQDREDLLGEFYEGMFEESATPMRKFFKQCETIWMNQSGPAFWLKFYHDFTQLELFPPEVCAELRRLLDEARGAAESELVRERVELVSEGFLMTELYSRLYHSVKELSQAAPQFSAEALVRQLKELIEIKQELERHMEEAILAEPLHQPVVRIEAKARLLPGHKLAGAVEQLAIAARGTPLEQEADATVTDIGEWFPESRPTLVWELAGQKGTELLVNGNFGQDAFFAAADMALVEDPQYTPLGWGRWREALHPAAFTLTAAESMSGGLGLKAAGAVREMLVQPFTATPGAAYLFSAHAKGAVSPGSRVEIQLYWLDESGARIEEEYLRLDQLLPGRWENWQRLLVAGAAPAGAVRGYASLTMQNQANRDVAFFDEISLREFR